MPKDQDISIDLNLPAIKNFMRVNKLNGNGWKTVPVSPILRPFFTFSETDLLPIFWKSELLKRKMNELAGHVYAALGDYQEWYKDQAPGTLITQLITDVGCSRKPDKNSGGYRRNSRTMTLFEMKDHINHIRGVQFDPRDYKGRGYIVQSTIRTDGFRLQLLSWKMNELLAVRYKRFPENKVPLRIASPLGGTGDYLTEIRNVVKSQNDVEQIWGCAPDDITILGLDLGQTFTVAAYVLPPRDAADKTVNKRKVLQTHQVEEVDPPVEEHGVEEERQPAKEKHTTLTVKQKAVLQATFKYRRWLQGQRDSTPSGTESIASIERSLPALRGPDASVANYEHRLQQVGDNLEKFYNKSSNIIKRHQWDSQKAYRAEYAIITDKLLKMIGGSAGKPRDESNKSIIAVGLGQFASKNRLSSLHSSFTSFFVRKVQ